MFKLTNTAKEIDIFLIRFSTFIYLIQFFKLTTFNKETFVEGNLSLYIKQNNVLLQICL